MWQQFFGAPFPEAENLLPAPAQAQAAQRIRGYWRTRGWQLVFVGIILWAAAYSQGFTYAPIYGMLALGMAIVYGAGFLTKVTIPWLLSFVLLFMIQGMVMNGLGAVTALSYLTPYMFAGMLLPRRGRVIVQIFCMVAFWTSLMYEVLPIFRQLDPPNYILVSYNILLAAFTFQTLRFLYHVAVEINTEYVAEQMRQQSQHFLARVSHELRTPLNSVLGFAKLLRRAELSETQTGYLEQIIEESEQLNHLVSDLLDSAHLSTGKVTLNLEAVDVNTLCVTVAEEQRPHIAATVELKTDLAPDMQSIQADKMRLRQALSNLVSNAVKYTSEGEIVLKTHLRGADVLIDVRDTGMGVSEDQQHLIFVPFVQLDSRRIGVGLGLDIALQLVRLHGGDITIDSQPEQGSTFTIKLPLNSSAGQ
jgi:signal transduction histidine kinase